LAVLDGGFSKLVERRKKQAAAVLAVGISVAFLIMLLIGSGLAHLVVLFLAAFCLALTMILVLFAVRGDKG
jgi:hypothetical protein